MGEDFVKVAEKKYSSPTNVGSRSKWRKGVPLQC